MSLRRRILTGLAVFFILMVMFRISEALLHVGNGSSGKVSAEPVILASSGSGSEVDWLAAFPEITEEELYAREQEAGGIVVICATNRLDMLDEAFTRSGRFDLKLAVGLPDKKARINILKIHGKNKKFDDSVDFAAIAARTPGFSGADLQALLNESALLAAEKGIPAITKEEINDSFRKIVLHGNKVKILDEETKRLISWHESGHTLATKLLTDDSVSSVTIIGSSSGAGGVTFRAPNENNIIKNRRYLQNLIRVMYAGRAAEEIYFESRGVSGEEIKDLVTIGASEDIKQATAILLENLAVYGLGESGPLDLTQFGKDLESVREEAKAESKRLYRETVGFLRENKEKLEALSEALYQEETLEEAEIDRILAA